MIEDEEAFTEWFFKTYDKTINEHKCRMAIANIDFPDREVIYRVLPKYVKATPIKKYRAAPLNWINGKRWNDEIPESDNEKSKLNGQVFESTEAEVARLAARFERR